MASFDDVWDELVEYTEDNGQVSTLSQGSENKLWYDADHDRLMVKSIGPNTNSVTHDLPYPAMKAVWETLQKDSHLRRENTREALGKRRGSVTMAIFQRALDLPYDENPVRVCRPD